MKKALTEKCTATTGEYKGLLFEVSALEHKQRFLQAQAAAAEEYAHQMELMTAQLIAQVREAG